MVMVVEECDRAIAKAVMAGARVVWPESEINMLAALGMAVDPV